MENKKLDLMVIEKNGDLVITIKCAMTEYEKNIKETTA